MTESTGWLHCTRTGWVRDKMSVTGLFTSVLPQFSTWTTYHMLFSMATTCSSILKPLQWGGGGMDISITKSDRWSRYDMMRSTTFTLTQDTLTCSCVQISVGCDCWVHCTRIAFKALLQLFSEHMYTEINEFQQQYSSNNYSLVKLVDFSTLFIPVFGKFFCGMINSVASKENIN